MNILKKFKVAFIVMFLFFSVSIVYSLFLDYYLNNEETQVVTTETTLSSLSSDSIDLEYEKYFKEAKEKKDSLIKESIKIIKYTTSSPNSAGGIDCRIIWKNTSEKTVKYATFIVEPYNAVNDVVFGEHDFDRDGEKILNVTGPVKPNAVYGYGTYWDCMWYNYSISYMRITGIEVSYMDGSYLSTYDEEVVKELGYYKEDNTY